MENWRKIQEGEVCVSNMFSEQGYTSLLMDAIRALERVSRRSQIRIRISKITQAKFWENCVEIYQSVVAIFNGHKNYLQLERVYNHLNHLCRFIIRKVSPSTTRRNLRGEFRENSQEISENFGGKTHFW